MSMSRKFRNTSRPMTTRPLRICERLPPSIMPASPSRNGVRCDRPSRSSAPIRRRGGSRISRNSAPPDPLNTMGQNWGLAGFNAAGLEMTSFAPFREMLAASMRYAGAIRLDHVLGLKRLYLVPHGFPAKDGAYVQMPFDALLAATAQESIAHRCVVIGEDLGTVPEAFREQMADWGSWSYQVMMFERDDHGRFRGIDHYAPNALVT